MDNENPSLRDIAQRASDIHGGIRGRALDREAKKLGLTLSYTTVDKILAGTYTSRPTRATLEALSKMAQVPLSTVYEAANMTMPMRPFAEQLPPEVDTLKADQRRIMIDLARQFVKQNKHEQKLLAQLDEVNHAPSTNEGQANNSNSPRLRAVAPEGDPRLGQKTAPGELGVTEIFGEEARNYPNPGHHQMAAHHNFKSERQKWEEAHGERGEESQDPGDFDE
ncbi:hypothetical protein ACLQ8T_06010 [Glutamicibacter sp. FR1]|uniref:hypothetical protein n=1 Tax=Glutamicibacter sp. FR1 TaxID=3393744 RepID=UPI0039AFC700